MAFVPLVCAVWSSKFVSLDANIRVSSLMRDPLDLVPVPGSTVRVYATGLTLPESPGYWYNAAGDLTVD